MDVAGRDQCIVQIFTHYAMLWSSKLSLIMLTPSYLEINQLLLNQYIYICDRICKKGSYTRTTSIHRFHHHTIHTLSDNPCVLYCGQQFTSLLFLRLLSEACQTSMNAWFVFSCLFWLLNKGHRAVRSHTTL